MKSTGWRTELFMLIAAVLIVAGLTDLAGMYDLGTLGKAATFVVGLLSQAVAAVFARVRYNDDSPNEPKE